MTNYKHVERAMKGVTYVFHLAAVSKVRPTLDPTKDGVGTRVPGDQRQGHGKRASRGSRARRRVGAERCDVERRSGWTASSRAFRVRWIVDVYGNQRRRSTRSAHLRTTTTPYATTKAQGEDLARLYYSMYDVEAVVARLFMVYGANEPTEGEQAVVTGRFIGGGGQSSVRDRGRRIAVSRLRLRRGRRARFDSRRGQGWRRGTHVQHRFRLNPVSDLADMISRRILELLSSLDSAI